VTGRAMTTGAAQTTTSDVVLLVGREGFEPP
jgi:hypothetical protein